jgi:tRNA-2-methylthio-N6-dimethylallyladenosine synthase
LLNDVSGTPISSDLGRGEGVYITTYGCQMNVNDTERMFSLLEMVNFTHAQTPEEASLIIINSCSVREKPVHKVHSEVGRYRKLKEKNPRLRIGVGGCVAQQEKQNLIKGIPLLDFVFGTDAIDQLPSLIGQLYAKDEKIVSARFEHSKPYQIETLLRNPGVSAFVNITKGCDNFCTFCVVPYTRGRERSRALAEIIKDIKNLTARGVKEVTLLGQNVNSYKSECGTEFSDLLRIISEDTDISRLRYTTSHPKDFDLKLCEISQKYRSKIMDYIHLPVQSGNSDVLARMNRGYTREQYLEKVKMIKDTIPGVGLSTDIIVGFPGETEEQYEDTAQLLSEVGYDNIYAFNYSPRPFTKAARWPDQIPLTEKSRRLNKLFALQKDISGELSKRFLNQTKEVLVESHDDVKGVLTGRTSENKIVHFDGPSGVVGTLAQVRITFTLPNSLRGEWIQ